MHTHKHVNYCIPPTLHVLGIINALTVQIPWHNFTKQRKRLVKITDNVLKENCDLKSKNRPYGAHNFQSTVRF